MQMKISKSEYNMQLTFPRLTICCYRCCRLAEDIKPPGPRKEKTLGEYVMNVTTSMDFTGLF